MSSDDRFPLRAYPRWLLVTVLYWLFDVEWDECWRAWPHCCGQARCWMHVRARWCECECRWCRIARFMRGKSRRRPVDHPV